MNTLFLDPLDVLYLRGNTHFASAGAHGEALMPPWPSLAAGAIRSRLMAEGLTLDELANFRLTHFGVGRKQGDTVEPLLALPADIVVTNESLDNARALRPTLSSSKIQSSNELPLLPALQQSSPAKAVGGLWLNEAGIKSWLAGNAPKPAQLLRSAQLWQIDARLGIALDAIKRSAADGKIYTAETVALMRNVGFLAAYTGAQALPDQALLRLGGDGRGAMAHATRFTVSSPDWERIATERRFRMLLTTPGIFPGGWQPRLPASVSAKLVAASVNRFATVSGWDIREGHNRPKAAQRCAPTGSVYWFDQLDCDIDALKNLAEAGLPCTDLTRHAEGFNHILIAPWAA